MQQQSILLSLTPRDEAELTFIATRYRYADYLCSNMEPEEEQASEDGVVRVYSLTSQHAREFLSLVRDEADGYLPMMAGQLRRSVNRFVAETGGNEHRELDPRVQWLKDTIGECERDPAWAVALRPELLKIAEIVNRQMLASCRQPNMPEGFVPPASKQQTTVVTLPDGYNGHTMKFYADPMEVMGDTVKLRCAEPGKEYMFTWRDKATVETALTSQQALKGKRILAIFQPQAWVDDCALDIDGQEEIDITEKVLALPLEKIHRLADQDLATDTVLYDQALEHDGPNRVEVAEQVCEFFAVSDLSSITEEQLLAERMAYQDVHSLRDGRPELALHGANQRDPYETISKLVKWSQQMGGWDASCWKEAAECLRDRQPQFNVQPGQKSPKPGAGSEFEP